MSARGNERRLLVLLALVAVGACSGQADDARSPTPGSPGGGNGGQTPGGPSLPGTGAGSGGSTGTGGRTGSGGSSAGTGGSVGAGGSSPGAGGGAGSAADAGASTDAAPPVGSVACAISLYPVSPQRWEDVPAGEGYKLRVEARTSGIAVPPKPNWRWLVTQGQREVPTTVYDGDPAVREVVTDQPGRYDIVAEILDTTPPCRSQVGMASAILPTQQVLNYRIRATPPPGSNLATVEETVTIGAGQSAMRILHLAPGRQVAIAPQDESGSALRSYFVRMAARQSVDRFEGYMADSSQGRSFQARLDPGRNDRYDVIIVPDSLVAGVIPPAQLFSGLSAADFSITGFRMDSGITVGGSIQVGDNPLKGARIRLRSGMLPSTVGQADAAGSFALRARNGRFEVRVVPEIGSGLPDALLPESSGLSIANTPVLVNLRYAVLPTANLALQVLTPEGAVPGKAVEVILETVEGALPDVGIFTLPGAVSATAQGSVRIINGTTGGTVNMGKVPQARYRATLVPPDDLPGAAVTTVEFAVAAAEVTQSITLARRSRILGRLLPAERSRDLTVRGLDTGPDGVRRTVTALVDAEGRYQLPVDPDRVYRLFVDPSPGRKIPRVPLVPVRARATDVSDEQRLPAGLPLTGHVKDANSGAFLPGVVIQVFCVGRNVPDCIDLDNPDISNTPPVDETVSGPDGQYGLHVPDPGL